MDGHFPDLLRLFENGKKSDSFAAHFEQHFKDNMSCTDILKSMTFNCVKQLNPIEAMKKFTRTNCNLFIEERLKILKKLREKCVTIVNKNLEIHRACWHKTTFYQFSLRTDDPVFVFTG